MLLCTTFVCFSFSVYNFFRVHFSVNKSETENRLVDFDVPSVIWLTPFGLVTLTSTQTPSLSQYRNIVDFLLCVSIQLTIITSSRRWICSTEFVNCERHSNEFLRHSIFSSSAYKNRMSEKRIVDCLRTCRIVFFVVCPHSMFAAKCVN